jgi:hypothetical protein
MKNPIEKRRLARHAVPLLVVALPLLIWSCALQTGEEQASGRTQKPLGPPGSGCDGIDDCLSPVGHPVCADPMTAVCKAIDYSVAPRDKECVYALLADPDCACVEGDVRVCSIGSAVGVRHCEASGLSTSWGSCVSL